MSFARYIHPGSIRLQMQTEFPEMPEDANPVKFRQKTKELLLEEIVELLDASGQIVNPQKLLTDLINRERKASTALGNGLALPHVRTMQARRLVIGFIRSLEGIDFDAPDGQPVHLFLCLAAPPYDDKQYLKLYKDLSSMFLEDNLFERLMEVTNEGEIIRLFSQ